MPAQLTRRPIGPAQRRAPSLLARLARRVELFADQFFWALDYLREVHLSPDLEPLVLEANSFQWRSEEEVRTCQRARLRSVLRHAKANIPAYRIRLRRVDLDSPYWLDQFRQVPPLEKAEIRADLNAFLADRWPEELLTLDHTGGSTGTPLEFYRDKLTIARSAAVRMRHDRWAGRTHGCRLALLWGNERDMRPFRSSALQQRFGRLGGRVLFFNAFGMDKRQIRRFVSASRRFKPQVVLAYANAAARIARYLDSRGEVLLPEGTLRGVITSAETLADPARALIQKTFPARVFDRYGSRECAMISSQCEHGAWHEASDHVYVEIVDEEGLPVGTSEEGEVLITTLSNYAMPLLRYRIGDRMALGARGNCPCGRGLRVLGPVRGRIGEVLRFSNGAEVHSEFFTHLFYGRRDVSEFCVVQKARDLLEIHVRDSGESAERSFTQIRAAICDRVGSEVDCRFVQVDQNSQTSLGKWQFVRSELERSVESHP